ncbi:condensin complex subunit 3 [Sporothrix brasiliensis 5110]|uniref:Condensin complex subunit 3 n=1 Tax=Sporothrix brasiliensis 5110 TaxID=1398154 RepID=A0A0C2F1U9_9PEZI|nr:condensin complex subunit 3 [Sporothrix brasiliensis 5110]KIH92919.1 condensin complex subunit 3 [Sporothrix brasiliensis 5110]
MPARTSRTSRVSSALSHKTSSTTLGRPSAASRASSVNLDIPAEPEDNALRAKIAPVFREAQKNTASHRKLAVNLRKIQEACCYEPTSVKASAAVSADFHEDDFNEEFVRCVYRVMPVKKSEPVGDKVIRFVGLFLRHAIEKDNELLGEVDEDASTMPETPGTRLTGVLVDKVLLLLVAKDKYVRYRATQLISHIVNSLDAIDDDLFQKLRSGLLRRIRDKEAMIRAQAVLGLGRLAGNSVEEAQDSDDSEGGAAAIGLLDKLLEVLQNDPSADVRRSLLVNLPILPNTLPYLLERARDSDAATRRAVYSRLLPALGDFRHLSLSMREKLLRWGLRDRDENVRKAAGRLFRERWIEDCAGLPEAGEDGQPAEPAAPSFDGLLELLERIDVVNSGVDEGVALEAMQGFWEGRPDYRDAVNFDDAFWETLSAESVFMARSFNDFCRSDDSGKYEYLIEEKLPEVTKLAFYLERYTKVLVDAIKRAEEKEVDEDEEDEEEDTVEQEFIVEQLLHIALTLDYSDEVGRRKMFALLRQSLSISDLPDEVTKLTVNVLRDICAPDAAGEREFCSVVLEAVADVHDTILDDVDTNEAAEDDSFHSARSEVSSDTTPTKSRQSSKQPELTEEEAQAKAIKEIVINLKCLHIVQCMLSNVSGSLQKNDHLVAMLNNLVVPAVRSHEAPVRERGLVCLGLCALLDRSLAEENLEVFMRFYTKGHTSLQITALHILTDILNVHGAQLLSSNPALLRVYVKALRSGAKAPEVQATATVAVSKLLLGRVVTDQEVAFELLKTLVVAYFEPSSSTNQGVRQALNYFLPVFCYSRAENQALMQAVSLDALHALFNVREGLEDDDEDVDAEMASLATIGACLVDWTDPRKCFVPGMPADVEKKNVNADVHLDFAKAILDRLYGNASKEEKKAVAPLLGKLYVSPTSTEEKIRAVYEEVSEAVESQLLSDATSRNALYKIHVSLGKIVNNLDQAQASHIGGSGSVVGGRRSMSRATSLGVDDRTILAGNNEDRTIVGQIKEEDEDEGDGVLEDLNETDVDADEIGDGTTIQMTTVQADEDSLTDDLLDD